MQEASQYIYIMPRIKSLIKIEGTLDELTFYRSQDGYMVRTKGGVSKKRMATDPAFARTRENGLEFGEINRSGKYLRRAILPLLTNAKDNRVTSRLTQVLSKVKNEDQNSIRGNRNVAAGISTAEGKAWIKGFNFNNRAVLSSILLHGYSLDIPTGKIVISDFVPSQHLQFPDGSTHIRMSAAFLNLDYNNPEAYDLQMSDETVLPINNIPATVTLSPPAAAAGTGDNYYFLKIAFYQEINGMPYLLNNGAHNALQLIEVI